MRIFETTWIGRIATRPFVAALVLVACATAHADEDRFTELTHEQFTLVSASTEHQTRKIARQILMFQSALEDVFGTSLQPATPTRIFALSARDWQERVRARSDAAGYFVAHPFSSDLLFDAEARGSQATELMFHEYSHHVLRTLTTGDYPAFFDEGLAEVFSNVTFDGEWVEFAPRPDHIAHLRRREWLPLERLLEVRRRDAEYTDHLLAPSFYAQAWATLYFAMASDSTFGIRLRAYIRQIGAGGDPRLALETLLDRGEDINAEIARFILARRPLPTARIRVEYTHRTDPIRIRRLTGREHDLLLGELLLRLGSRSDTALALLDTTRYPPPMRARAEVGAGAAHLQAGRPERAIELFDLVPSTADLPCDSQVMLGRGLYQLSLRDGAPTDPDEAQRDLMLRARAWFESALRSDDCWIAATNGYVLAALALNEADPSMLDLAGKAYDAAPRSAELAVSLALLHEMAGRKSEARPYWVAAARHLHEGPTRAKILENLEADSPP